MPIDDRTSTQNYPKPNIANTLADDVGRLRTALDDIDADMAVRVTTSDTGTISTTMLANDAVTYAKIQNVSATDRLLGRSTAGAGDVEEITCTAAGRNLLDDADAAAQRTTLGLGTLATQSGTFSGTSSGTNTGDQTITLTGDVTGTGTGSFTTAIAAGVIVDADVNASAAIAGTKISPNFGSQAVSTTGTITGASLIPTSATVPTNGLFLPAANQVGIATNGASRLVLDANGLLLSPRLVVGPSLLNDGTAEVGRFQIQSSGANNGRISTQFHFGGTPVWRQAASASTTLGTHSIVANGSGLGQLDWYGSDGAAFIKAAEITCLVDGTPSAGVMPARLMFSTTPAGSGTAVERMRIRSDGNIGIGGAGSAAVTLYNQGAITGGTTAYGNFTVATVQSDVTAAAYGYVTQLTTAAATFTLGNLQHFLATGTTKGAGSTITTQIGFHANANLTQATDNYGFYGNLASTTGRWNFYAAGTAPNYFAGDVRTNTVVTARTVPANSNVTATATASSLLDGLRTGTPTANINLTLPTGTAMDAAFQELQTNQSFEWSVINLAAATHVITVVANTAHTVVGNMGVAANSSGRFLTRKTAANTFISYRIG